MGTGRSHLREVAGGGLIDRRSFLQSGLAFTAAAISASLPLRQLASQPVEDPVPPWMRSPGGIEPLYGLPSPREEHVQRLPKPTTPQTAIFSSMNTPLQHQQGILTPSGLHFTVCHNGIPDIDPARHHLIIHGLVERPLRFDIDRLLRYPLVSRIQFLECSGNTAANAVSPFAMDSSCQELFGQASCSEWTGIPLSILFKEAGLKPNAKWVIAEGADGGRHSRSLPLSKLMADGVLALYQNGERLRPSQGYPMRLWVPGWEGNVNVKWLHRLEVVDQPAYTKDESSLYTEVLRDGRIERFTFPMDVKSVITHPSGKQALPEPRGYYDLSGLAWSGHGAIAKVEVSADAGKTWATAQLDEPVINRAFTRFRIPWEWDGRSTTLLSRATDSTGRTQPTRSAWKKRYAIHSFNHYNAVHAWKVGRDGRVENTYA